MGIRTVCIIGERCSGTNYVQELLTRNLTGVSVGCDLFGWKHGFHLVRKPTDPVEPGSDPVTKPMVAGTMFWRNQNECRSHLDVASDCLFVMVHRNPLDWIASFGEKRYACAGDQRRMTFSDFIRQPTNIVQDNRQCQEIMWCRDKNGARYENHIKYRTALLKNHLEFGKQMRYFLSVSYESVRDHPEEFIQSVSEKFNIAKIRGFIPIPGYFYAGLMTGKPFKPKEYKPFSKADFDFIVSQLDLEFEKSLGHDVP